MAIRPYKDFFEDSWGVPSFFMVTGEYKDYASNPSGVFVYW